MIYTDGIHLISDESLEELHQFAQSIGIKRCWYHSSSKHKHYDIPKKMRENFSETYNVPLITSKEIVMKVKKFIPD